MFHVQTGVPNWLEAVFKLPSGVVVKTFQVQQMSEIKAANPAVGAWHRFWNDPYQVVNVGDTEAVREQRARGWFNQFVDGTFLNGSTAGLNHALSTDFVSWWNEYYADSQSPAERELWWRQERTAARIWRDEYRNGPNKAKLGHIRLTICATAVGNNIPWQSAETAVLYDAVLDYHPYDKWLNGGRESGSWPFYSGRWVAMDEEFRGRGFTVKWLFGEGGPYSSPVDGWRHSTVCGADAGKYVAAVKWWIEQCRGTAAYQQGRVLGPPTLFTTGGSPQLWEGGLLEAVLPETGSPAYRPPNYGEGLANKGETWATFETKQPELNALADMCRAEWAAVTPPPDPEPPPVRTWSKKVYLLPQATSAAEYDQVQGVAYPTRSEIAFSADSAFARPSNVTGHEVVVYNADRWGGQQALLDFVADYYGYSPATKITWRLFETAEGWVWPVSNALHQVNHPFGEKRDYDGDGVFGDRHEGADLYARPGDMILAARPGKVVWASDRRRGDGMPSAYGWHVILEHGGDTTAVGEFYESWYCHLAGLLVKVGDVVAQGQVLGPAGSTGNSTGVHLHFNVRKRGHVAGAGFAPGDVVDPMGLLNNE